MSWCLDQGINGGGGGVNGQAVICVVRWLFGFILAQFITQLRTKCFIENSVNFV